jgi:NAD(P)-dependent dehydrogenase (short-subunit alcohol dehydrogenase family)
MERNIAIIGASGAIGHALVRHYLQADAGATILAFSRSIPEFQDSRVQVHPIDLSDETQIEAAARIASQHRPLDLVIVATGLLHDAQLKPEKALRDLSTDAFMASFAVNTIGPTLVAKHFLPLLHREKRAVFAALSARVGSISDNRSGGWYAYRAAKAALNMVIRTAAIEMARKYPKAILVGLHPGTVDSPLSHPFQSHVAQGRLFTPDMSAEFLARVIAQLDQTDSGRIFAWDGEEIQP